MINDGFSSLVQCHRHLLGLSSRHRLGLGVEHFAADIGSFGYVVVSFVDTSQAELFLIVDDVRLVSLGLGTLRSVDHVLIVGLLLLLHIVLLKANVLKLRVHACKLLLLYLLK